MNEEEEKMAREIKSIKGSGGIVEIPFDYTKRVLLQRRRVEVRSETGILHTNPLIHEVAQRNSCPPPGESAIFPDLKEIKIVVIGEFNS